VAEVNMFVAEALLDADAFHVEVSGWDENETLFVERSDIA
jgi:hypothetical protein